MIETATVRLPAYWASALINGDASGLEPDELSRLDAWCDANPEMCIVSTEGESYFTWDMGDGSGLGGDVFDYVAFIQKGGEQ